MQKRYAIRLETHDGTLEEACHFENKKIDALRYARQWSKTIVSSDVVRIWVDDTKTDLGVKSFDVSR